MAFLQRYATLEQAEGTSVEELTAFLRSLTRVPNLARAADRISTGLHQPQVHADPVTPRVKTRLTQALVAQLLSVVVTCSPISDPGEIIEIGCLS